MVACATYPANRDPHEIDTPFGIKCAPAESLKRSARSITYIVSLARTSLARAREEHGLEPGREVVHDRKVARRDEEVAHANQHRDLLPEQERREHRLRRQRELDEHEEEREDAAEREWDED